MRSAKPTRCFSRFTPTRASSQRRDALRRIHRDIRPGCLWSRAPMLLGPRAPRPRGMRIYRGGHFSTASALRIQNDLVRKHPRYLPRAGLALGALLRTCTTEGSPNSYEGGFPADVVYWGGVLGSFNTKANFGRGSDPLSFVLGLGQPRVPARHDPSWRGKISPADTRGCGSHRLTAPGPHRREAAVIESLMS